MSDRNKILKHFEEQSELMNTRVNSGIELYRKGYARIKFTNANGELIKNITFIIFFYFDKTRTSFA